MPLRRKTKPGDTLKINGPCTIKAYKSESGGIELIFLAPKRTRIRHLQNVHQKTLGRHKK